MRTSAKVSSGISIATMILALSASIASAEVRDSTDLGFGSGGASEPPPLSYSEVRSYPEWADIQNKPATATRWPSWNEVNSKPAFFPARWSDLQGVPETFEPRTHYHDDRYLTLSGGSLSGRLTAPTAYVGNSSDLTTGKLVVASSKDEPEIMLHGMGSVTAQTRLNLISEAGDGFTFRIGGHAYSNSDEVMSVNGQGTIRTQGGLKVHSPYIPGNIDFLEHAPPGLSYVTAKNGDATYPTPRGTALTLNHSKARAFQMYVSKGETPNLTFVKGCHDKPNWDDNYCPPWSRVVTTYPGTENTRIGGGYNLVPKGRLHIENPGAASEPGIYIRTDYAVQPDILLHNNGVIAADASLRFNTGNGSSPFIFATGDLTSSASEVARITANGVVRASDFQQTSDERLKENIQPITDSLERIGSLSSISFTWKDEWRGDTPQIGLIAQEVRDAFPELVTEDEETGFLSVSYTGLVAPLVAAVNELREQNVELKAHYEAEVTELRERTEMLEAELAAIKELLER